MDNPMLPLIIVIIAIFVFYRLFMRDSDADEHDAGPAMPGGGRYGDNAERSTRGMQPLEMRLKTETADDGSTALRLVQVRGLFGFPRRVKAVLLVSIHDATDGEQGSGLAPVLCMIDDLQESDTFSFRSIYDVGAVESGQGFSEWATIAVIVPDLLVPPVGGPRKMLVQVRLCRHDQVPTIRNGFLIDGAAHKVLQARFNWTFSGDGYRQWSAKSRMAEECVVRLAMSVAYLSGEPNDAVVGVIKAWVTARLDVLAHDARVSRRKEFNEVLRGAERAGVAGQLSFVPIVSELSRLAQPTERYAAVELCLSVIAAGGDASARGLDIIGTIAQRLDVDPERFKNLRDKVLPRVVMNDPRAVDVCAMLQIDPSWGKDRKRAHLNELYVRWNARAEAAKDPAKRAEAERMLEWIAQARLKCMG